MLQVVLPNALKDCSVFMRISTRTIGLVVSPFTLEDVTISVSEFAFARSFVLVPVTLVPRTICPLLNAEALFLIA